MMAAADIDGNGSISFSEFVTTMHSARHQGQASAFAELVDKVRKPRNLEISTLTKQKKKNKERAVGCWCS